MNDDKQFLVNAIEKSTHNKMDVAFRGNGYTKYADTLRTEHASYGHSRAPQGNSSCKILQRKLELKVERARKSFRSQSDDGDLGNVSWTHFCDESLICLLCVQWHKCENSRFIGQDQKPNVSTMIPIDRLAIPKQKENVPLVEYKSEHRWVSRRDLAFLIFLWCVDIVYCCSSDDDDASTFFPHQSKMKKIDLSDTFSLQEMAIDSDESDSDSQNLEFLTPSARTKFLDKLINFFCCLASESWDRTRQISSHRRTI